MPRLKNRQSASDFEVGEKILIVQLDDPYDSSYSGRVGVIEYIDDIGQLHGTWGGLAVIPGVDQIQHITDDMFNELSI